MKRLSVLLLLLAAIVLPVSGEGTAKEIRTPQELAAVAEDPGGDYILMEDLDMEGIPWKSFDFSGTLDGNGHSILNLAITEPGTEHATALDGNQKEYSAVYGGLFAKLEGAEVKNLGLINIRGLIETEEPCLLGGVAGYSMDSTVSGCTVTGQLELRAHEGMIGVAGVLAYGVGTIENCDVDVTLICVDTDAGTSDEQFLGGAFATGFLTVTDCNIKLDAYISEHGFVHSGGVAGMLLQYPIGMGYSSRITGNTVDASITFFEDSAKRRAYCGEIVGELLKTMNFNYGINGNTPSLRKTEVKDYTTELRPETCVNPHYTETVVPSDCYTFGYTEYICDTCGYTYRDHYQLHAHTVTQWTEVKAATETETGLSEGLCDICGASVTREDPVLEPPAPESELEQAANQIDSAPQGSAVRIYSVYWLWGMAAVLAVAVISLILLLASGKKKPRARKYAKGGKYVRK